MKNYLCQSDETNNLVRTWHDYMLLERQFSSKTIDAYIADIWRFFDFQAGHLGQEISLTTCANLKASDFRAYLSFRRQNDNSLSNASIGRNLASIRSFFDFCDKKLGIINHEIALIKGPKINPRAPRPISENQALNLIDKVHEFHQNEWLIYRDEAIFALLYGCGLRIFECLNLKPQDFDNCDALRIIGKGKKERIVPLLDIVNAKVQKYIENCPYDLSPKGILFFGLKGKKLNAREIQKLIEKMRSGLGLMKEATPHALRHSYASHLLAQGCDLRSIQELLGHASLSTTQKYTKIDNALLLSSFNAAHPRA